MAKKKNKFVKRRHQFNVPFFYFLLKGMFRRKWGFDRQLIDVKKYEPFIVVSNHVTPYDPILLTGSLMRQVYYVASELIFSKGIISRMLEFLVAPIPKTKSQTDITSVKTMIQVIKEGGNVGVFVEGNSTMTGAISQVPAAIGKLVLLLKVPLVITNFHGGYLSNPRWSRRTRKGWMQAQLHSVLTYDDYKHMSAEEINDLIIDRININAYVNDTKRAYPGKKNAEGLERLLFTCPFCHTINSGYTKGREYFCDECGKTMSFDDHGLLHSKDFETPQNTVVLDKLNKLAYQEALISDPDFSVEVDGRFSEVFRRRRRHFGRANFKLTREGITITMKNRKQKTLFYPLSEVDTLAMQQKELLVIYINKEQTKILHIERHNRVSSYQLIVTMQILKNIEKQSGQNSIIRLEPHLMGL